MSREDASKLQDDIKDLVDHSPCTPVEIFGVFEATKFYVMRTVGRVAKRVTEEEKPGDVA